MGARSLIAHQSSTGDVPERDIRLRVSKLMARYFIDVRDSQGMVRDEEGALFSDIEEALEEAKASARDLVKQYLDNKIPLTETCIEVRDTESRTVATLTVAEVLSHPVHPEFKEECGDVPQPGHR